VFSRGPLADYSKLTVQTVGGMVEGDRIGVASNVDRGGFLRTGPDSPVTALYVRIDNELEASPMA
jgi:hypothetical protein